MKERMRKAVLVICGLYLVGTVLAIALLLGAADDHWLPTVMAFGPRWPLLAPGLLCLPLALVFRRWAMAGACALALLLTAGPYMGLSFPFPRHQAEGSAEPKTLRIGTFNIQGRDIQEPWVESKLKAIDADVVALTECEGEQHKGDLFGYHTVNVYGICLFSKLPVKSFDARNPEDAWAKSGSGVILHAVLEYEGRPFHVVGLHLATVRGGLNSLRYLEFDGMDQNIELRRWESETARAYTNEKADGPLVVMGDFNMPVESSIYEQFWGDLTNSYDECAFGYGATKHTRWFGVRIDHVLTSDAWRCHDVEILDGSGSDHTPIIATLELLDG